MASNSSEKNHNSHNNNNNNHKSSCRYKMIVFDWKGTIQPSLGRSKIKEGAGLAEMEWYFMETLEYPFDKVEEFKKYYLKVSEEHERETINSEGQIYHAKDEAIFNALDKFGILDQDERNLLHKRYYNGYNSLPIHIYDGAVSLLQELSETDVKLALVRNSSLRFDQFQKTLKKVGCSQFFTQENTVLSGEIGVGKPDKKIFEKILEKMNAYHLLPNEIVMIGNETETDIEGACRMGWDSILMTNTEKNSNGKATKEFATLEDARKYLFCETD